MNQESVVIELKVDESAAQVLLAGLGKLPAEVSFGMIMFINQKLDEARKAKNAMPFAEPVPDTAPPSDPVVE